MSQPFVPAPAPRGGVTAPPAAHLLAAKIGLHTRLSPAEAEALVSLISRTQSLSAGATLAAAGEPLDVATIVLGGMLARTKLLPDGRRQILAVLLPGDVIDAHASVLARRDDNLEAICASQVATVPQVRVAALGAQHPRLYEALLRETFIEASIAREWVLNVGRRTAKEALAHLMCELALRMEGVGLASQGRYPFPLKQQHLADALGLSTIHLNRVLQELRAAGMIQLQSRQLRIPDTLALCALGKFRPDYLHLVAQAA